MGPNYDFFLLSFTFRNKGKTTYCLIVPYTDLLVYPGVEFIKK